MPATASILPSRRFSRVLIAAVIAGLSTFAGESRAADDTYTGLVGANPNDLSVSGNWLNGLQSGQVALFDKTMNASGTGFSLFFDIDAQWLGIRLVDPASAVSIDPSDLHNLTLAGSGIDMSGSTSNLTLGSNLSLTTAQTWTSGPGALFVSGNVALGSSVLTIAGSGTTTISGPINGSSGSINKVGLGRLILTAQNGIAGSTTATNGSVELHFGTVASNILNPASTTLIGSGTLILTGAGSQSLARLTLNPGSSTISVADGNTLTYTNVTQKNQGDVSHLTVNSTGKVIFNNIIVASSDNHPVDTGGNPYITFGLDDWAARSSVDGSIIAATRIPIAAGTNNFNTTGVINDVMGDQTAVGTTDFTTGGALRFGQPTPYVITINSGATFTPRGILVASTSGGGTITGGNIRSARGSGTSGDLFPTTFDITQNSLIGDLTIGSTFVDASTATPITLIKSGVGRLILTGTSNANRQGVTFNGGAIRYDANTSIAASGTTLSFNGGGEEMNATFSSDHPHVFNSSGGFITVMGTNQVIVNASFTLTGAVSVNGSGSLVLTSSSTSGAGGFIVTNGTLRVANSAGSGTGSGPISVSAGGKLIGAGIIASAVNVGANGMVAMSSNGRLNGPTSILAGGTLSGGGSLTTTDIASGATVAPGIGTGTLTLGAATIHAGSAVNLEFNSAASHDLLQFNGAVLNVPTTGSIALSIYDTGATTPYLAGGVYTLASNFTQGAGNFSSSKANVTGINLVSGHVGDWSTQTVADGTNVDLVLTTAGGHIWKGATSTVWSDDSQWTNNQANGQGQAAIFDATASSAVADLGAANRSVGELDFDSRAFSTIASTGGGILVMDSLASATINESFASGNITISAPMALNVNTAISLGAAGNTLTLAGPVNGAAGHGLALSGLGRLVLAGANSYTGATSVGAGGTIEFGGSSTQSIGILTGSGSVIIDAGTIVTVDPPSIANLSVLGSLIVRDPLHTMVITGTLSITGNGSLDLTDNKLIVEAAASKSAVMTQLAGLLNSGAIFSSGIPAGLTLALVDNAHLTPTEIAALGLDVPPDANSAITSLLLLGDDNLDGVVNGADFAQWFSHTGASDYEYNLGDFNRDGVVDNADFQIWYAADPNASQDLTDQGFALDANHNPIPLSAVPEPASLALAGLTSMTLALRRRKQK